MPSEYYSKKNLGKWLNIRRYEWRIPLRFICHVDPLVDGRRRNSHFNLLLITAAVVAVTLRWNQQVGRCWTHLLMLLGNDETLWAAGILLLSFGDGSRGVALAAEIDIISILMFHYYLEVLPIIYLLARLIVAFLCPYWVCLLLSAEMVSLLARLGSLWIKAVSETRLIWSGFPVVSTSRVFPMASSKLVLVECSSG